LIGAAMCKALTYLHSRKPPILHRDVKPGNVKISPDGEIFLVDFGLAKVVQGSEVTTTGARAMTPGYSPPEQYGTARTDPRTDVYSLGATLYAALTGVIPEDGLARAMENAELTPVRKRAPKVSRRLAAAVEKAMQVDADDRFQTAEEFRKALLSANSKTQRLVEDDFTVAPSPSVPLASIEDNSAEDNSAEDNHVNNPPSGGVPLTFQTVPPPTTRETPRQKRRKSRWKFVRFLLLMILIVGGIAVTVFYLPEITAKIPGLEIVSEPTATSTFKAMATESLPVITETESATATATIVPTATNTPEPTLTPTPTNTPTPSPTPIGGGAGQIAFVSDRAGAPQIYLANIEGNGIHPITNLADGACQPDWSPDGEKVVFVSPCEVNQDFFNGSSLYIVDAEGANLEQLSSVPGGDFEPAWSPDGKHIAFTSLRDGYMQIYSINLDDSSVQRLTETDKEEFTRYPAWSPFGNQIAYAIKRYSAYQIWAMTDTGQSPEQITGSNYTIWNVLPAWSPDGTIILYSQYFAGIPSRIWLMSIRYENRGNEGINVITKPLPVHDVDYSEDGFWLVFGGKDGENQDVYMMTAAGASRTRLTTDPGNDFDPVWRPLP